MLQSSAASYVVSPAAVIASAADRRPTPTTCRRATSLPLAGRMVREVGALARLAGAAGKRLPTLTLDTQIGFR